MQKRIFSILSIVISALLLVACASAQLSGTTASSNTTSNSTHSTQTSQTNGGPNFAGLSLEEKLSIGTLKLEGTDQAITADQAKTLLPLWKAVKSLSSNTAASTDELTALYQQIEEAMTAPQVQAIKNLSLSGTDLQDLMKQYNIQAPQGGQDNGMRATRAAQSGSGANGSGANGGAALGGPADPGGMPPDGGPGGMPGDATGGSTANGSQPRAQGTPPAGGGPARRGMPQMFIDPVITLLEQRAG